MLAMLTCLAITGCQSKGSAKNGAALAPDRCSRCHPFSVVESHKDTDKGWSAIVDRMIGHGLQLTAQEKADIIAYLANK
jgi:cytochrome c2